MKPEDVRGKSAEPASHSNEQPKARRVDLIETMPASAAQKRRMAPTRVTRDKIKTRRNPSLCLRWLRVQWKCIPWVVSLHAVLKTE